MRFRIPKQLQAAWAAWSRRPSGSGSARSAPSDDYLGISLIDRAAAPPAPSPTARSRIAALRSRMRSKLDRVQLPSWAKGQKRSACGATQTDPEPRPVLRHLAAERMPLIAEHSASFQAELKQPVIATSAEAVAKLQREMVMMRQAELQRSARVVDLILKLQSDLAEQRRRALRAELQELSHREHTARRDIEMEADDEWSALTLAFQAPGTSDADGGETTEECIDAQSTPACEALPCCTVVAQLTFPEPTSPRSPTFARECLFIDRICHWVAAFVRRDWARTCSTSAYAVFKVLYQVQDIWRAVALPIGRFQSSGTGNHVDSGMFGPELGPLLAARQQVTALRNEAVLTPNPDVRWGNTFALHMQLTAHLYDEMRLRHRQMFHEARYKVIDLGHLLTTLDTTLKSVDARLDAAEESTDSD